MQRGIPVAIVRQKSVRHKNCKTICTIGLEIYAWRWLIRVEKCSKVNIYVILKLSKYIILLCRRKIYCRFTIARLSYHTTGWLLLDMQTQVGTCPNMLEYKGLPDSSPQRHELHMIYISSNNGGHHVTKTFSPLHVTTLHSTSLHLSTLHFLISFL